jgi:hypothetical protein
VALAAAPNTVEELGELLREIVGVPYGVPERLLHGAGEADRAAEPIRPGQSDPSTSNCSATTSGRWFGSITPPVPTRIRDVAPAIAAASTVGAEPAIPGTP